MLRAAYLTVALLLLTGVMAASSFYQILGVAKDASEADIKRAYRKLSKKYHPDINPEESAHEKFIQVSRAYEILSESETRAIYDRGGEDGLKRHEERKAAGAHDPFAQFFGGGREAPRGPSVHLNLEVQLADMYAGRTVEFQIPRRIICSKCSGSGANSPSDIHRCKHCNGAGAIVQKHQIMPGMYTNVQMACPHCGGKGEQIAKHCGECSGARTVEVQHTLAVHVPAGAPEGFEETFQGEADESPDIDAGDVVVRVRSKRQNTSGWTRKEGGLVGRITLSVEEALLGFERNVTTLDGRIIGLSRTGTTQPGEVEVVEGEGMPAYHDIPQGDMFIEYSVVFPTAVSGRTRSQLAEVFRGSVGRDEL